MLPISLQYILLCRSHWFCCSLLFPRAEVGSKIDPIKHAAVEVVDGEEDGIILKQVKSGFFDKKDGDVLRYFIFLYLSVSD